MRFCSRRSVARHNDKQIPGTQLILLFNAAQSFTQHSFAAIPHNRTAVLFGNGQTDAVDKLFLGILFPEARGAVVYKHIDDNRRGYEFLPSGVDL